MHLLLATQVCGAIPTTLPFSPLPFCAKTEEEIFLFYSDNPLSFSLIIPLSLAPFPLNIWLLSNIIRLDYR